MATQAAPTVVEDPRNATLLNQPPAVSFATAGVQPPSPLYIRTEDHLYLWTFNATLTVIPVIVFHIRFLRPDGVIVPIRQKLTAQQVTNAVDLNLGEGFILSISATAFQASVVKRGQVYVQAFVTRGIDADQSLSWTLLSDYVTSNYAASWPGGILRAPQDGPGNIRSVTGAAPAAGVDIFDAVPNSVKWRLISAHFNFQTAVAVANRFVNIAFDDGVNSLFSAGAAFAQAASLNDDYYFYAGGVVQTTLAADLTAPIPVDNRLVAGMRIRSSTLAIQAADQFAAAHYLIEEWIDI